MSLTEQRERNADLRELIIEPEKQSERKEIDSLTVNQVTEYEIEDRISLADMKPGFIRTLSKSWFPASVVMMLGLSFHPFPAWYYTLLHWMVFLAFSLYVSEFTKKKYSPARWSKPLISTCAVLALAFNPIVPLPLDRIAWTFIEGIALVVLIGCIAAPAPRRKFQYYNH